VCDQQTRRFNQEAGSLLGVTIYTISMDLPFAQGRWCAAAEVENLTMLSDHKDSSFGSNYGTLIKELRLNCRAIFVVDEQNNLRHVEYVGEVAEHPDYDAVLSAVNELIG
jgi:thiol peroxidase